MNSDGTKEAGVEQAPWDPTGKWNSGPQESRRQPNTGTYKEFVRSREVNWMCQNKIHLAKRTTPCRLSDTQEIEATVPNQDQNNEWSSGLLRIYYFLDVKLKYL